MNEDYNNSLHLTAPVITSSYIATEHDRPHKNSNTRELVDKWFIKPLRKMKDHDGFICLICLFPLYERHLRHKRGIRGKFKEGHRVFKEIGHHLNISEIEAFHFWQHFRNGLLHHATPEVSSKFRWVIRRSGQAIERDGNVFLVHPFAVRDRLLEEIEKDLGMWKANDLPLSVEFTD